MSTEYTLLIIDPQQDFHNDGGALGVYGNPNETDTGQGGVSDSKKIIDLIDYKKPQNIFVSLDTHTSTHISHAGFWTADNPAEEVNIYNSISIEDNEFYSVDHSGKKTLVKINMSDIQPEIQPEFEKWVKYYVKTINEGGKFKPTIWPNHCLESSEKHKIYAPLQNALNNSGVQVIYFIKGQNEATEMYSVFEAELPMDKNHMDAAGITDNPEIRDKLKKIYRGKFKDNEKNTSIIESPENVDHAYLNTEFNEEIYNMLIENIQKGNYLVICGEALSHCVNWSVQDLIKRMKTDGYDNLISKIILLKDASSIVFVPDKGASQDYVNNTRFLLNLITDSGGKVMTVEEFKNMLTENNPTGGYYRRRTRNKKDKTQKTKKRIQKKNKKSKKYIRKYSKKLNKK